MLVENIRELCKQNDMTIAQLERESKISNGNIARWNEQKPSYDKVKRVADTLGTTVDELLKN